MISSLSNLNFYLKLRSITGDFDHGKIKNGLQTMGYDAHTIETESSTAYYNNGISTRLLYVKQSERGLELMLPPFSCSDNWEMLRDWLLVFNTFHTAIVITENDLVEDIESFFSTERIELEVNKSKILLNQFMSSDEKLHFYSIHRDFYAGSKIFERIREQPEEQHLNFLNSLICKSQYTSLTAQDSKLEKINENLNTTFSIIDNNSNIILKPADMIKIQENDSEDFFIAYVSIDKLLRHGWMYLDEKQIYIPEMSATDWKLFCIQAKEMSINTEIFSKYVEGEDEDGEE